MDRKLVAEDGIDCTEELAEVSIPEPNIVEFYRLLNNREIVWNDAITDWMVSIPMYIFNWNREDAGIPVDERKPIKIWINSDGGDPSVTLFTANVIALSKTPVITIGMSRAYSSAVMLLMAGHKRLIFDSTSVLIHDGFTEIGGDTGKVIDSLEFAKEIEARVRSFVLKHTKIPESLLDKNYRRDWFLFSEDAIRLGIADKIVEDIEEII